VASALDRVGLAHAAHKKAGAYSLGMKQRLGLANALLMPRDLLVLDEPTNGLDPQGTREVRALVRSFAADGTTVFVSSHLLAEVEQLCTHVGVMSAGRLVAQGTLDDFRRAGAAHVDVQTPDVALAHGVLTRLGLVVDSSGAADVTALLRAETHRVGSSGSDPGSPGVASPAASPVPAAEEIVAALVAAGVRVRGFAVRGESLEQRFVELTGEGFDVVA
jgi:ABC-2 type transport system ATP-binding protein